ncbi:VOC family protein [Aquitalea sp.]|uniref:VOC family protein n=1 Tax=Aquitalea sp. TaxID=1872623 RepID=UPI00258D0674|nr:VOC family protein [Aquitalea sp.]
MEYHYGRLFDHVHLLVHDLAASKQFYRAVLQVLGRDLTAEGPDYFWADELFVSTATSGQHSHVHLAFQTGDPDLPQRLFQAGLAAGGQLAGQDASGPRLKSTPLLRDPDGNFIEAVFHSGQRPAKACCVDGPAPFTVCE